MESQDEKKRNERTETSCTAQCVPFLKRNNKYIYVDFVYMKPVFGGKEFDSALLPKDGLAAVELSGKWGFIDLSGKVVVPLIYDHVYPFSDGLAIVKINGRHGAINQSGEVIVPYIYDYVTTFSNGLAMVELNRKYGMINKSGKIVTPIIYDYIYPFSDGLAKIKLKNVYGLIDISGEVVVPVRYNDISDFWDGLARVSLNSKIGFINNHGIEIIPPLYDGANNFWKGIADVWLNGKKHDDCRYGCIDTTGKVVIPIIYDTFKEYNVESEIIRVKHDWERIGRPEKAWKALSCSITGQFSNGLAKVRVARWTGFIDLSGDLVIPFKFDDAEDFSEGMASVKLDRKYGFIDTKGRSITPIIYDAVGSFKNGVAKVAMYKNTKEARDEYEECGIDCVLYSFGLIDKTGREIFPIKYDYIEQEEEELVAIGLNRKQGLVDRNGSEILPINFHYITKISEALLTPDDKFVFYDIAGREFSER